MAEADLNRADTDTHMILQIAQLERENRKLRREITHLQNAVAHEKLASTTALNQQKASTFIQRERERYLALLLANSPSIIFFLSQTNRIEFCTEYFIAKAGFKNTAEVLGRTLTEILPRFMDHTVHEKLLENIQNVTNAGVPQSFDITFHFGQNKEVEDFAGLLVPMIDEQHHNSGTMLMFHDVTDLKRTREEALEASKAKSAFLSNMSHEIRTPLNAIIGMTAIGQQEKDLERKNYAFEKIESASTHLLGVLNDILDISKIESGKMELSFINFDFKKMLDRVMSVIAIRMQDKQQHFCVEIDSAIPQILYGDDQRLAQVIANILSNAAKFTPEYGDIIFNTYLQRINNDTCVIQMEVKDSGIGMSPNEQGLLFNIFQQAEAGTARKYGGSGLGLAISKRILEMMNGDIWVESEVGKGSCFFFTASLGIPDQTTAAEDTAVNGSAMEIDPQSDFTGKIILLADDIDINLEIVVDLLAPTNITIDTVKSGKEAVETFAATPGRYDLILMDVQMPEVDGLQATRMIRALDTPHAAAIPIIAMTANVFKEDIEKCIEAGMNNHLGKPIDMKAVIKILSKYLQPRGVINPDE